MEGSVLDIFNEKLISAFFVAAVSLIIYVLISKFFTRKSKIFGHNEKNINKKRTTYINLFRNICRYVFIIVDAIIIFSIYGVNMSSVFAGVGIVSLIAGLALQDALKDIIAGANILIDSYYSVGDFIEIDGIQGMVTEIGLKVTKLKDINNGNVLVIANRNFVKALNLSKQLDIDVPIPYNIELKRMEEILKHLLPSLKNGCSHVESAEYKGIQDFGEDAMYYKLRLSVSPEFRPQARRDALRLIKGALDENGIEIPYKQIDIHEK